MATTLNTPIRSYIPGHRPLTSVASPAPEAPAPLVTPNAASDPAAVANPAAVGRSLESDHPDRPVDPAAASRRSRGRVSRFSPRLASHLVDLVRQYGLSPSKAGLVSGIPTSTLSRWRPEDPDFADDLEAARARVAQASGLSRRASRPAVDPNR